MASVGITSGQTSEAPPRVSEWQRFRKIFFDRGVVLAGTLIVAVFILIAVIGPLVSPYDPYAINLREALQGSSSTHWLGTDAAGRDTLSRLIYGARTSLEVGLMSVILSSLVGITLGIIAAYYGGWIYTIIMRFVDALMSFPMMLLAMFIAAMLGGGEKNVIIALSVSLMPQYARLMCGQVLSVKEYDYIAAVKSLGASDFRILVRHIFSNAFPPLVVQMTLRLGHSILSESSLSFLGIGIQPPTAAWGSMVSDGRNYLTDLPIMSLAPGLAIMLVVFAFNMVGDGLRDALDPRLRGRL
ncbi:ABC transporter permease [Paenibacillus thalictri]|uniref:ABC transporter permease n=1 Tax=Paenibacillus thalictri TaxID=2527873 RepID=A0A4Q9DPY9_9BACL|nr:ABC transporter permease [Paenibacillus thalictri]TBL76301.1 ABC transporter permease [Paenibacillus thalictri]